MLSKNHFSGFESKLEHSITPHPILTLMFLEHHEYNLTFPHCVIQYFNNVVRFSLLFPLVSFFIFAIGSILGCLFSCYEFHFKKKTKTKESKSANTIVVNPFSPKSDSHLISPYKITPESHITHFNTYTLYFSFSYKII